MSNFQHEGRSRHRENWLEALPVFRSRAGQDETLPPPDDDVTMVGFADDLLFMAAMIVGDPAAKLYPHHLSQRVVLKRVWKQRMENGAPNPNYGRFYCVSSDGTRYFQWLTETLFWKSRVVQDVLCPELYQWFSKTSWPIDTDRSDLYHPVFHRLYNTELSVKELARGQIQIPTPQQYGRQ
jgi:hypothetical protein